VTASRSLALLVHGAGRWDGGPRFVRHSEADAGAHEARIRVMAETRLATDLEAVYDFCRYWEAHRHDLGFEGRRRGREGGPDRPA